MTHAWIGHATLQANDAAARFWSLNTDIVSGRLILNAPDAAGFHDGLTRALTVRGLTLNGLSAAEPITSNAAPELVDVANKADETTPLMFGRLCDAALPHPSKLTEIARSTLQPASDLWALIDGVAWPDLPKMFALSGDEHACLYTSTDPGTLASAPWLIRLKPGSALFSKIIAQPADQHSCLFLRCTEPLKVLRKHLRKFTMVSLPGSNEAPVYFRFYDPRVTLDLASALSAETLARLMGPITMFHAPLSPTTLLPDHAETAMPLTPFDSLEACQDRIVNISMSRSVELNSYTPFRINDTEYQAFQKLQKKKAKRALARRLAKEFPDREWTSYRTVAEKAMAAGVKSGLVSVKQVSVIARCMMMQGHDFLSRDAAAAAILARSDLYPWQKKNALIKWLIDAPRVNELDYDQS